MGLRKQRLVTFNLDTTSNVHCTTCIHIFRGGWKALGQKKVSLLVRCPDFRGTQTGCLGQPNVSCLSRVLISGRLD